MRYVVSEDGIQIGSLYAKVGDAVDAANERAAAGFPSTISAVGSNGVFHIFIFEIVGMGQLIIVTDLTTGEMLQKARVVV